MVHIGGDYAALPAGRRQGRNLGEGAVSGVLPNGDVALLIFHRNVNMAVSEKISRSKVSRDQRAEGIV